MTKRRWTYVVVSWLAVAVLLWYKWPTIWPTSRDFALQLYTLIATYWQIWMWLVLAVALLFAMNFIGPALPGVAIYELAVLIMLVGVEKALAELFGSFGATVSHGLALMIVVLLGRWLMPGIEVQAPRFIKRVVRQRITHQEEH